MRLAVNCPLLHVGTKPVCDQECRYPHNLTKLAVAANAVLRCRLYIVAAFGCKCSSLWDKFRTSTTLNRLAVACLSYCHRHLDD
eukprot:6213628-Pleurochrysis_carterae.AAC.7